MPSQALAKILKSFFGRVHDFEKVEIFLRNRAGIHHRLEINNAAPILAAVNDHENSLGQFLRLRKREDLEKLIQGSETTGEDDQRLGQVREPELTHKKVMKFEVKGRRDIRIWRLFGRQIDVEPDRLP